MYYQSDKYINMNADECVIYKGAFFKLNGIMIQREKVSHMIIFSHIYVFKL